MEPCCILTTNPFKEGRVFHQTPNFFLASSLGPMKLPYVLIISRQHYEGTGDLPQEQYKELDDLTILTRAKMRETYKQKIISFEHGPKVGMCGWGCCVDHLHIHTIAGVDITDEFATDMLRRLDGQDTFYQASRKDGLSAFARAAEIFDKGNTSYVMFQDPNEGRLIAEVGFPGESQWLRKLIAKKRKDPYWNWRTNPDREFAIRTAETLTEKF